MKNLHVLVIPSWYPYSKNPTSGIFFKEQAECLANLGIKIGVIAPVIKSIKSLKSGDKQICDHVIPSYISEYYAIPRFNFINSFRYIRDGKKLFYKYISDYGWPDLLHAHCALDAGKLARTLNKLHGLPYALTEHSSAYGRSLLGEKAINSSRQAYENASKLIAVSPFLAKQLENSFPSTTSRWEIIPNLVDTNYFIPAINNVKLGRKFRFIVIGHLNKNKDIVNILKGMSLVGKNYNFDLSIVGEGEEYEEIKREVAKLNLSNSVEMLGELSRDEIRNELDKANVLISSSRYETFGVVLIEALSMGLPVIATRSGGPQSIVEAINGILVNVDDPTDMANAMMQIYDGYNLYNKFDIRNHCREKFGHAAVTDRIIKIYTDVLGE